MVRKLEPLAENGDTVVDFSCGANEFVPMFKDHCTRQGKRLMGRAYDIIAPKYMTDFDKKAERVPASMKPSN